MRYIGSGKDKEVIEHLFFLPDSIDLRRNSLDQKLAPLWSTPHYRNGNEGTGIHNTDLCLAFLCKLILFSKIIKVIMILCDVNKIIGLERLNFKISVIQIISCKLRDPRCILNHISQFSGESGLSCRLTPLNNQLLAYNNCYSNHALGPATSRIISDSIVIFLRKSLS